MKTILSLFNRGPGLAVVAVIVITISSFAIFSTLVQPSSSPSTAPPATATLHPIPLSSPTALATLSTATPQRTATASSTPSASPTALPGTVTPAASPTATPRWSAENIRVTGERPIDATGNVHFLDWSPKGDKLLFRKSFSNYVVSKEATGWNVMIGDLWLMDVNGTSRRLIAKAVGAWSWSLDGKYLAYSAPAQAEGTQGDLFIVDTTTLQERKLTTIMFTTLPTLQWLPSSELIFLRNGYMFAIRPDGTGERQLNNIYFTPAGLWDANRQPRLPGQYLLSPNGKRIAYWTRTFEDSPLWLANLDGSNAVKISDRGDAYAWAPDGEALAFAQARVLQRDSEIWLVNADGTNRRRLVTPTSDGEFVGNPTWSPDSQVLVFDRIYQPSYDVRTPQPIPPLKYELWVINRDGIQARLLYDNAGFAPRWAPDKLVIAFKRDPDRKITSTNSFLITVSPIR